MPVWIMHISHRHGEDYWLFETRERAEREAADWAALWWEKEFGDLPKPADPDEVSRAYWDRQNDHGEEWCNIVSREVEG
jgi:hypothetical protein